MLTANFLSTKMDEVQIFQCLINLGLTWIYDSLFFYIMVIKRILAFFSFDLISITHDPCDVTHRFPPPPAVRLSRLLQCNDMAATNSVPLESLPNISPFFGKPSPLTA